MRKGLVLIVMTFWAVISTPVYGDIYSDLNLLSERLSKDFKKKQTELLFKKHIAVLNFIEKSPALKNVSVGETVSKIISAKMSESTLFILVESENRAQILKEIELGMTGVIDPEKAPQAGKLLGAEMLLSGVVSEIGNEILIHAELVSVETGEIYSVQEARLDREEVLAESKETLWSSFRSKYGLSVDAGMSTLFSTAGYEQPIQMVNLEVGYRTWEYLRFGLGYTYLWANEIIREQVNFGVFDLWRNYNISGSGPKVFIDFNFPVLKWMNIGIKAEYIPLLTNQLQQDIADMPMYISTSDTGNTPVYQRVLVNSWATEENMPHLFIIQGEVQFLISKRVSVNILAGYLYATVFTPTIYEANGIRHWSEDIDVNGKFLEYGDFNFARFGIEGDRVVIDMSGVIVQLSLAVHF